MAVEHMKDALATGFVESLGRKVARDSGNIAPVVPHPMVEELVAAEHASSFGGDSLTPVVMTPGNLVSGMPKGGVSGAPAHVGSGDMIADYHPEEAHDAGAEDTGLATSFDTGDYGKPVGNMVTGMPKGNGTQDAPTELSPEGNMTGQSKGGYAPSISGPTSNDRGVAGQA